MAIISTPYYIRPLNHTKNSSQKERAGDLDIIAIQPGIPIKATWVTGNIQRHSLTQFTVDYFTLLTRIPVEVIIPNVFRETLMVFNAGGLITVRSNAIKPTVVPRYCYWNGELKDVNQLVTIPKKCGVEFLLIKQTHEQLKQWVAHKIESSLLPEQIVLLPLAGQTRIVVQSVEKRRILSIIMASLAEPSIDQLECHVLLNWLLVTCWQRSWQIYNSRLADASLPVDVYRIYEAAEGLIMSMDQQFSLRLLAKQIGMNPNLVQAQFKVIFGCSVFRFLLQVRMAKATYLLQATDLPIDRIGFLVGYPNAAHFSTVFKKHSGRSPSEIRSSPLIRMGSFTE
ncbi:helix-turn-helix transcriptional regulator [Flavihumibacter fluvii]|uniref:helix-turn-helix transcriptional regulator n=1 Tax=Flavihumibacter fluvii TaxID=2838157 RepID=UPI001BDEAE1C|nr:helix-turn-helix domain-containing protein [Flavihumibacter fluvii]ULQ52173.1 AraC family transcriptional regulator [Flavihumibacter fluvii]